jgi:KH domain
MIPENCREVARKIGSFYLAKNKGNYSAAQDEIVSLLISEVKVEYSSKEPVGTTVVIVTGRPGRIIGKRGSNIDELCKYFAPTKIKIVEEQDPLIGWLVPIEHLEDYYEPPKVDDFEGE